MKIYTADELLSPEENIHISKEIVRSPEPSHTHEFIELVYIFSGKGIQCVNDISFHVAKGDFLFINYNQVHSFSSDDQMVYVNFLFKPEFMSTQLLTAESLIDIFSLSLFHEFKGELDISNPLVTFAGKDMIEIECLIEYMLKEYHEKEVGYKSVLKGYMQVILSKLIRKLKFTQCEKISGYIHRITPEILKYIDDNCFEKLTLTDLAQRCFYNEAYFSRIFKECYGKSFTVYVIEKRISEAMRLLSETDIGIDTICRRVGYGDKGQFYKVFKQHTGVTPKCFRTNQKNPNK